MNILLKKIEELEKRIETLEWEKHQEKMKKEKFSEDLLKIRGINQSKEKAT